MQMLNLAVIVLSMISSMRSLTLPDSATLGSVFSDYQAKFAKKYSSTTELTYRQGIYQTNLQAIQDFNSGDNDWVMGENNFTDMTLEERQQFLGIKDQDNSSTSDDSSSQSTPTLSGVQSSTSSTNKLTSTATVKATFSTIATSVNWVTAGAVSPVKDQGQCGGCYAFSTIAQIESLFMQKFKVAVSLSEQELISCSSSYGDAGCNGGLISDALNYVKAKGVHLTSAYPYTATTGTCKNLTVSSSTAAASLATSTSTTVALKVATYTEVGKQSLLSLLVALQTGPVSIAFYVTNALYSYKSGLFSASNCSSTTASSSVNHAVLAVGYSTTGDSTTNNKPYLLVKNSWGTSWGDSGYFKIELPTKNGALVDAGNGTCGMTIGGYNYIATLA